MTGAAGLLGSALTERFRAAGADVTPADRSSLDVTDRTSVAPVVHRTKPELVLHCAGYTAVDRAESEEALAHDVNALGTRYVADAAAEVGALFVYFSTDFVFDGEREGAYRPDDVPKPLSAYGRSKLAGERETEASGVDALVVRTSWLYGAGGPNFVATILRKARAGERLRVVDDQRGSPTWTADLADATYALVSAGARGVTHVTNTGSTTWHELACTALELAGVRAEVVPVSSEVWGAPAMRPRNSVLDLTATTEALGAPLRPWREALRFFLRREGP